VGLAARQRAEKMYSLESSAAKLVEIIHEAVASSKTN
jgi:hypothetical protein